MKTHTIKFKDVSIEVPETGLNDASSRAWRKGHFYEANYRNSLLLTLYNWNIDPNHKYYQRFSKGDAVDIGAGVGNHSLFFSSIFDIWTTAFEPQPNRYTALHRLAPLHFVAFNAAIGDKSRKCGIKPTDGGSYAIGGRGKSIDMITLDSVNIHNVSLIKIDTEGYEAKVLKGAKETIAVNRPIICAESNTRADFMAVAKIMEEYGYQLGHPKGLNADKNMYVWEPIET